MELTKKQIFENLRRVSNNAYEDFLKTKIALDSDMEHIEFLKSKIDIKEVQLRELTRGKQYTFLKLHELEIDELNSEINRLKRSLDICRDNFKNLEMEYQKVEVTLIAARKKEDEFFNENF